MIAFSCHTWAFNDLTLMEALGTIARLGFQYVDIGSGQTLNAARAAENPRRVAAEIRDDLTLFNLQPADLYLMLPRINLADDEKRQKELDLYKALLPFAEALGTPGITLSPGLVHPADDAEAWDRTVAALREMVRAGKAAGLRVSVEPHLDSMAHTPDQVRRLVREVPDLTITLDWAHMICQDIPHDDIAALLPYTRHIQLRQAAKAQLQTPFDRGRIDIARLLTTLDNAGYDGLICIEYMQTPGWHGMLEVDTVVESARLRDALRDARDQMAESA
jgi:sugar phosphate isomerase/epimerase